MNSARSGWSALVPGAGVLVLTLLLGGCVTETSGGFNVEHSDAQALQDYLQLAIGYFEKGDLANTKRHLSNAASIDANNSEVFAIWGLVYSREGELDLADENFRRALRVDSGNSQARNNFAAFLFANGHFEEAYVQLEQVVQDIAYPGRSQAFENLGLAALRLERPEDAEYAFGRALQLNARQVRSSLELAAINLQKNDVQQARDHYRNYVTLLQFYNFGHNARSLWLGVQVENTLGNEDAVLELGSLLETSFSTSPEYRLYQQLLDMPDNE